MALPPIEATDWFPIVRQVLLDTFRLDSVWLTYPYTELKRLDMGLRKLAWGTYSTDSPIFSVSQGQYPNANQIIVLKSKLGFYNLIIPITDADTPDLIGTMPFRQEPVTIPIVNQIMKENGIPPEQAQNLYYIYSNIPVINIADLITTLQHLLAAFLPSFSKNSTVEYLDYTTEHHKINMSEERIQNFNSDYIDILLKHVKNCMAAITSGNQQAASETMKALLDFTFSLTGMPSPQLRSQLLKLNIFISAKMFDTTVPPYYIFKQILFFEQKISEAGSTEELLRQPYEMARKYSMLAKNYTYDNYSLLIRNVVNYIDQHLAEDLSLAAISASFGKNASYLSNAFKKEAGETLTSYVSKQRIQASLRYFNTTDLSIAEVALEVGYTDYNYFSKIFKKYIGCSPREYKKMLDK